MLVTGALRHGDQEHQVGGAIGGTPVDPVGGAAEHDRRLVDPGRAGVGDADPALDAGGEQLLAGCNVCAQCRRVTGPAGSRSHGDEAINGRVLRGGRAVEIQLDELNGRYLH